eukprot:12214240-Prorocentrum_lima.AAC.1
MTSSLVGSEMCIRDRFCGRAVDASPRLRKVPAHEACLGMVGLLLPPVSYTHLTLPTICSV